MGNSMRPQPRRMADRRIRPAPVIGAVVFGALAAGFGFIRFFSGLHGYSGKRQRERLHRTVTATAEAELNQLLGADWQQLRRS